MHNATDTGTVSQPDFSPFWIAVRIWVKHVIAGNPFYLASAGLFLFGINQLTTDPKLVGAEYSMLRFNFCALIIYEILLVVSAIALARRRVWYDALLLVGLANLFVIVPFSLISRAVYLSPGLARAMCVSGVLLAVVKFWAFRRHIPGLNLPGRLLILGLVLLLANAVAPLMFREMAEDHARTVEWLNAIWLIVLPFLAGLANLLPRPVDLGDLPGQKRWLPLAFYFGWTVVTVCHFGGIGYSASFDWNFPLLVPVIWVASWTLYLRRADFVVDSTSLAEEWLLFVPLLLPLLACGDSRVLPVLAILNLGCYGLRLVLRHRSRIALIQFLGATTIVLAGLPAVLLNRVVPGMPRVEWVVACMLLCFFWLIFLSQDPRVALVATIVLFVTCGIVLHARTPFAIQVGLIALLAHSLLWDDRLQRGSGILRGIAGVFWVLFSSSWLGQSPHEARLPVYLGASSLLIWYVVRALSHCSWRPWAVPVCAVSVLASEPGVRLAADLSKTSPGFIAITVSFLLFAFGSLSAFSKSKNNSASGRERESEPDRP